MCLACMVKSLNLGGLVQEGPPFWYPQTLSNFIFSLYLLTLKISCVQLKRFKSLNFGIWNILEPPLFVRFGIFDI